MVDPFTLLLTSEVLHKVLQFHLALRLHVGAVHVRVEEDDGEGQDEDGVWVSELPHHCWVADAVPLADEGKNNNQSSELLRTRSPLRAWMSADVRVLT